MAAHLRVAVSLAVGEGRPTYSGNLAHAPDKITHHYTKVSDPDRSPRGALVQNLTVVAIRGNDLSLDNPLALSRLREENDTCHIPNETSGKTQSHITQTDSAHLQGGSHP